MPARARAPSAELSPLGTRKVTVSRYLVITLDPGSLENPDLDIRYQLPDLLAELSSERLRDAGYDYTEDQAMEIFLTYDETVQDPIGLAKELLKGRQLLGNDIASSARYRLDD